MCVDVDLIEWNDESIIELNGFVCVLIECVLIMCVVVVVSIVSGCCCDLSNVDDVV